VSAGSSGRLSGRSVKRVKRADSRRDDLVPYAAVVLAVLAIVFLLPSALRPPVSPPSETAELSPDAPPDPNQDSIISTVNRGRSGTGDGEGEQGEPPPGQQVAIGVTATTSPPPVPPPAACPYGYGRPPRQTFSIYSPPCAATFTGDNGGATAPGVTATEIRMVVSGGPEGWVDQKLSSSATNPQDENGTSRTWRIYQEWLNSHYQFYGRKLRFYAMDLNAPATATNPDDAKRAKVTDMKQKVDPFAVTTYEQGVFIEEAARQKIVATGEWVDQYTDDFYQQHRPYIWTWHASATTMRKLTAEYVCGRLVNRPAKFAGPQYVTQQRKFAVVYQTAVGRGNAGDEVERYLKQQCGVQVTKVAWDTAAGPTVISRLVADGVTSVINTLAWGETNGMTNAAAKAGYFPEWIIGGEGVSDTNVQGRINDPAEWSHAFGISAMEIEEPQGFGGDNTSYWDATRAYKEIDPAGNPDRRASLVFFNLQQIANGIQMAGPNLTPETFEKGLFSVPLRQGPPNWAASGGFRPGNYGYATAVGEIWWDTKASDSMGNPGAFRWTRNGERWTLGHLPPGETTVFTEGIAVRPADWSNY
jgi:hypothetical protein